jgi:hypothetical protein
MKKPETPYKKGHFISEPEYEEKFLKTKLYVHPECIERYEENWQDEHEEDEVMPPLEEWWYNTDVYSLQELLDMSKGMDPKDIFISVHRDREIHDISVTVSCRIKPDIKAWRAGKAASEADYEARLEVFKKDMIEYRKWEANQKIEELKNKLGSLEKGELDEWEDFR